MGEGLLFSLSELGRVLLPSDTCSSGSQVSGLQGSDVIVISWRSLGSSLQMEDSGYLGLYTPGSQARELLVGLVFLVWLDQYLG